MAQLQDSLTAVPSSSAWLVEGLLAQMGDLSLQQPSPGLGLQQAPLLPAQPAPVDFGVSPLSAGGLLDPAALQLAALQQQLGVATVPALSPDLLPLLNLSNLLAQQQRNMTEAAQLLASQSPRGAGSGSAARGTGPLHNPLYKTELCRSWEEIGSCRYAGKCQFAHGREELRPVQRHPKYKTEVCRTFAQTGTCPYGTRCRFIHHDASLASLKTPSSRDSSNASLSAMLEGPATPRSPSLAGLAVPSCQLAAPFHPITPSPSMPSFSTRGPGTGASSPTTPPAGADPGSAAAAAAALAQLLSVATAAGAVGAAGPLSPGALGGPGASLSPGLPTAGPLSVMGLGGPSLGLIPQGLPPIGVPMGPAAGLGASLGPAKPQPPPALSPLHPAPPASGSGLASAPATPTAAHPSSRVVRRGSADGDNNRRLPIFAKLAEREALAPGAAGARAGEAAAEADLGSSGSGSPSLASSAPALAQ